MSSLTTMKSCNPCDVCFSPITPVLQLISSPHSMTCLEFTVFLSERRGAYLRIIAIFAYDVTDTILLASQKMALGAKTHTQAIPSCNFNFDFIQTNMIFVK